jgi:hypothetical protein
VVRTDAECELKESEPCVDCMHVIKELNIKRIIHSTKEDYSIIHTPSTYIATHRTEGRRFIDNKTCRV